jgi:putative tryptophan/tyrosine transport system substrate-binding protein
MKIAVVAFVALAGLLPAAALTAPPTVTADSTDRLAGGVTRPDDNRPGPAARYAGATTTWLELLGEAVPRARRVSILLMLDEPRDPDAAAWSALAVEAEQTARRRALRPEIMTVRHRGDLLDAFVMMRQSGIDAVVVLPTRFALDRAADVAGLATGHRLPLIGGHRRFTDAGALMSYGLAFPETVRRALSRTNGHVEGSQPPRSGAQPARFELVINDKTARSLGLTLQPSLRQRADRLIE